MTQGWIQKWIKKRWKKVKNPDLWKQLVELTEIHHVQFNWVKGHSGVPENERCDQLAVATSRLPNLPPDIVYESEPEPGLLTDLGNED
ncbi:MAG: hypothetical protein FJY07_09840, partial [Bacteroidetes bacterium]|nr:hypothetical protein [Bacteroidota bacterium]